MSVITKQSLKIKINKAMRSQGYQIRGNKFLLTDTSLENIRSTHSISRRERLANNIIFLEKNFDIANRFLKHSHEIDISKIQPRIIEVKNNTIEAKIFRWWNLMWWSLPHERSYGRQMRFIVWDDYHNSPMGLISLQSPIISWKHRDEYLELKYQDKEYWINQSMNAQRLGALPPYNNFLGGKLIASLMTSNDIVDAYRNKYSDSITHIKKRFIPANLLFITTTGAFGKSSVFNRLKDYNNQKICEYLGDTKGAGSFHIPLALYESFVQYLEQSEGNINRGFGNGPSRKLRIISKVLGGLGYKNGSMHNIKRAVYFFNLTQNIHEVIHKGAEPIWVNRNVDELTDYWKKRWAIKRQDKPERTYFNRDDFLTNAKKEINQCKETFV